MADFPLGGATILLRLDVNSPINPLNGSFLDDTRVREHLTTLRELAGAKVVVLAHQSKAGKEDYTSLKEHARAIQTLTRRPTKFVDDLFGSHAISEIRAMTDGEIIVLENTRFYAEEELLAGKPFDAQAKSHIVRKLAPEVDYFINDAYAAAHRSQPTLVGFTRALPSMAGRLIEKEIAALNRALRSGQHPAVAVLGGAKVDDSIDVMEAMVKNGSVDTVLTGGVVANIALLASGANLGKGSIAYLDKEVPNWKDLVARAGAIMKAKPGAVRAPSDVVVNRAGRRVGLQVKSLPDPDPIFDIGLDTMIEYSRALLGAKVIVANGPMGVFEVEEFAVGTRGVMEAIARSSAYKVVGGGHTAALVTQLGMSSKIDHVSTGGGALISHLGGKPMPVLDALAESKKLHLEGKIKHRRA
jgi:phosphoglycerate kinase